MYCGDETGAFIGDVGSHTARFGYGGEDCPKVVVPSAAYSHHDSESKKSMKKYTAPVSLMRFHPGEDADFIPIYSSLNSNNDRGGSSANNNGDGLVHDIDAWASLWEYSYQSLCVRGKGKHTMGHKYQVEPELQPESDDAKSQTISSGAVTMDGPVDHPLLAVDSTSRTIPIATQEKQRAAMLETLFESLSAPAAYIAPSSMLSSFAYGRQTSLVVDIGHSGSRVTPLVDGYCLSQGSVSSGRGGQWLGKVQQSVLEGVWNDSGTIVNKWNGWGENNEGGNYADGVPPCRTTGVVPRYQLHQTSTLEKYSEDKLNALKQTPYHSMAVHEVMYEMMTSQHIRPLDSSEDGVPPFYGYGKSGEEKSKGDDNNGDDVMEEDKKEEDEEEEDDETPCYILPDGTKVDLAKTKAGNDLCRLPVSSCVFILN